MFKYSIALQNKDEETYGIDNLELCDGVFGKPLYLLSGEEIEEIRNALIAKRQRIVLYSVDMPLKNTAENGMTFDSYRAICTPALPRCCSIYENRFNRNPLYRHVEL